MLALAGGMLFLYGLGAWGEALQKAAARRVREWIGAWTRGVLGACAFGTVAAFLSSSSAAVSVLAVTLTGAGILSAEAATCVLGGAGVGTALTVQLLALRLGRWAPVLMALGFLARIVWRNRRRAVAGDLLLAGGLLFLGLDLMGQGLGDLRPAVERLGPMALGGPVRAFLAAAAVTVVLQGSTATLGVAMVLAGDLPGLAPGGSWLAVVAGANVGTCSTAFLAAAGGDRRGLQVAVGKLGIRLAIAAAAMAWIGGFGGGGVFASSRGIAAAHLLFNGAAMGAALAFHRPVARVARILLPASGEPPEPIGARYLSRASLETPEAALHHMRLELARMAHLVEGMVRAIPEALCARGPAPIEQLRRMDDRVDAEQTELTGYLSRLAQRHAGEGVAEAVAVGMSLVDDLENIGDVVTRQVAALAEKRMRLDVRFSPQGEAELLDYHAKVAGSVARVAAAVAAWDRAAAYEIAARREELDSLEERLRRSHIERISHGMSQSLETSAIHMDLLYALRRIHDHAAGVCMTLSGIRGT